MQSFGSIGFFCKKIKSSADIASIPKTNRSTEAISKSTLSYIKKTLVYKQYIFYVLGTCKVDRKIKPETAQT